MFIDISENSHKIWFGFFCSVGFFFSFAILNPNWQAQRSQLVWRLMPSLSLFDPGGFEGKDTIYTSDRFLPTWDLTEVNKLWPVLGKS